MRTWRLPRTGRVITAFTIACALTVAMAPTSIEAAPSHVRIGYYANSDMYDGYYPSDIPVGRLTHIDYAFGKPGADGKCALSDPWADYQRPYPANEAVDGTTDGSGQALRGNLNQLRELKAADPGLKVLISVGGWTFSKYFSDVAASPASRKAFVKSCIDLFIKGNLPVAGGAGGHGAAAGIFDGIDIDWEFPVSGGLAGNHYRASDRHDATLLFQEFRRQLTALGTSSGHHYLLTAAIPGGNQMGHSYEFSAISRSLDWIGVMAYDYHGAYDPTTNFDSPFKPDPADPTAPSLRPAWNIQGTVAYYRSQGVPKSKIVVGVPFYGTQYIRVDPTAHGLYQSFANTGMDGSTWQLSTNPTYHDLVNSGQIVTSPSDGSMPHGLNGYARYWSDAAGEPWLWNASTDRNGDTVSAFISYEDAQSIAERVGLIKSKGLRGAMVWELSQDSDNYTLLDALSKELP